MFQQLVATGPGAHIGKALGSAAKGLAKSAGLGFLFGKDHRAESLKSLRKAIRSGDVATVMRKASQSKYKRVQGIAQAALAGAGGFDQSKAAYQAANVARKAATWGASAGTAAVAGLFSQPGRQPVSLPATSAPSAPRALRPCAYGPRGTDGYCPPKPTRSQSTRATSEPRPSRPCAYGPRGADGLCPKRPRSAGAVAVNSTAYSRGVAAAQRELESSARAGATRAVKAGVSAAGGAAAVGGFILKASLVGAAGVAAYWLTSQLMKARFKTWAELHNEVANQYRAARQNAAAAAGRGLTPEENSQFSQWYKQKASELRQREAAGESLRSAANLTFKE